MKNRIDILLRLTSPMHVSYPGGDGESPTGNFSRTVKKRIISGSMMNDVPYFGANGFRGAFRRYAADRIMDAIVPVSGKVSTDMYLGLSCGAASSSLDPRRTLGDMVHAANHVYMGLFGGGARMVKSRYGVSDIVPVIAATIESGTVPKMYADDIPMFLEMETKLPPKYVTKPVQPWQLVEKRIVWRIDDMIRVASPESIERHLNEASHAVAEHQMNVLENKTLRKEGKKDKEVDKDVEVAKKTSIANGVTLESVIEGTLMHFSITLSPSMTEAQFGLLLLCISDWNTENNIGGWGRAGMGQFIVEDMNITFKDDVVSMKNPFSVGDSSCSPFLKNTMVLDAINAANDAIGEVNAEEIKGFFNHLGDK